MKCLKCDSQFVYLIYAQTHAQKHTKVYAMKERKKDEECAHISENISVFI